MVGKGGEGKMPVNGEKKKRCVLRRRRFQKRRGGGHSPNPKGKGGENLRQEKNCQSREENIELSRDGAIKKRRRRGGSATLSKGEKEFKIRKEVSVKEGETHPFTRETEYFARRIPRTEGIDMGGGGGEQ